MQGIIAVLRHEADIGQNEATPSHTATAPDNQANISRMGQHKLAKAEDDRNMEAELQIVYIISVLYYEVNNLSVGARLHKNYFQAI